MVISDYQRSDAESVDEVVADELLCGQFAEIAGKVNHMDLVDTESLEPFFLFFERVEQAQLAGILPEDAPGVRPEGNHGACGSLGFCRRAQKLYHLGVAQVDSIEETSGGYNHFTSSKS